jgi:hypothetical protein
MGDKGRKKDKDKSKKQSNEKQKQKDKEKADKQPAKKSLMRYSLKGLMIITF